MTEKLTDGGPAFPHEDTMSTALRPGMSLRDWFAGQIIGAVIAATANGTHHPRLPNDFEPLDIRAAMARDAYEMADAMLAQRAALKEASDGK